MQYLILETAALMLAAYFIGAMAACLIRRLIFVPRSVQPVESTAQWQVTPLQPAPVAAGAPVIETGPQTAPVTTHTDSQRFERALREAPQKAPDAAYTPAESLTEQLETIEKPPERDWSAEATKFFRESSSDELAASDNTASASSALAMATSAAAAAASVAAAARAAGAFTPAPAPEPVAEPVVEVAPQPEVAPVSEVIMPQPIGVPQDLRRLRAIDQTIATQLNKHRIFRYEDIARLTGEEIAQLEADLKIPGRIFGESWVAQAVILAGGGDTAYTRGTGGHGAKSYIWSSGVNGSTASHTKLQPATASPPHPTAARVRTGAEQAVVAAAAIAAATAAANRTTGVLGRAKRTDERPDVPETNAPSDDVDDTTAAAETRPTNLSEAIRENTGQVSGFKERSKSAPLSGLKSVKSQILRGRDGLADIDDDLKRIRGIGVLVEKKLNSIGVNSFGQIANWTKEDVKEVSAALDFQGRIEREHWIEQARLLASKG